MSLYSEGDLPEVNRLASKAVKKNKDCTNDLRYIEAISSLGESFAKKILNLRVRKGWGIYRL